MSDERIDIEGTYKVAKSVDVQQKVFGWASVAATPDGERHVDFQDDVIDPGDLEAAAHEFTKEARRSGEDHDGGDHDGELISSMVFTDEMIEALSINPDTGDRIEPLYEAMSKHLHRGWFVGFHLPDSDAFERAVTEKSEFSIEGTARVEDI
jgi:hypothetical protein